MYEDKIEILHHYLDIILIFSHASAGKMHAIFLINMNNKLIIIINYNYIMQIKLHCKLYWK